MNNKQQSYEDEIYNPRLKESQKFVDFVGQILRDQGIILVPHVSKELQHKGENTIGFEIKNDKKFKESGNLYIEFKEKADPQNIHFPNSGILRTDNTWLWIIGDYHKFFILAKKDLIIAFNKLDKYGNFVYRRVGNNTKTSEGFLLPEKDAQELALKIWSIND
jgi:hypothetical protein